MPVPGSCAWHTWGPSATQPEALFHLFALAVHGRPAVPLVLPCRWQRTTVRATKQCTPHSLGLPEDPHIGQPLYTAVQYSISLLLLPSSFGTCASCCCKARSPRSQHPPCAPRFGVFWPLTYVEPHPVQVVVSQIFCRSKTY